jgi:hypothetical protein
MKYLILLLLAAAGSANADECTTFARTAELVMQSRQMGIDSVRLYDAVEATDPDGSARALILAAYNEPRFHAVDNQQYAIAEFRNKAFVYCKESKK